MPPAKQKSLPIQMDMFRPGMRLGVAVSGGADSVALLRRLAELWRELGLVLTVLHVHHGVRGPEADSDADFVEELTGRLGLRFLRHDADTPARAKAQSETLEEAARNLRYGWFDDLLAQGTLDAVATAHTLDDQAETVLLKLLRGAWTEGLAGIFPVLQRAGGVILRPLLETRRSEVEGWLRDIGQAWREDATNADVVYTRNRVRHHLLPILAEYNPQILSQLGNVASLARDEEDYWQKEITRILPSLLLPGRAVRGGGRASSTHPDEGAVAVEAEKIRALAPAVRRRVMRAAAERLGHSLNFEQTELLLAMCANKDGRREVLTARIHAERTPRELRLVRRSRDTDAMKLPEYELPVPGEVAARAFGVRLIAHVNGHPGQFPSARLRVHKAGDRVRLRHSGGPKRIKGVLERLQVPSERRNSWPVLEWQGEIVWILGAGVESKAGDAAGLKIEAEDLS